mgnify:FL=1
MESGYTYPERSLNTDEVIRNQSYCINSASDAGLSLKKSAEVIVGGIRSRKKKSEAFTNDEGLNERDERMGKVRLLVMKAEPHQRTTYLRIGWKPKVKSKRSLISESI